MVGAAVAFEEKLLAPREAFINAGFRKNMGKECKIKKL